MLTQIKKNTPVLAYYENHPELGGMPCIYKGEDEYERLRRDDGDKSLLSSVAVYVLETIDNSTLFVPQHLVFFGKLPDMETYEKIKTERVENKELEAKMRKGQLEAARQAMMQQQSGIVGGRMV